MDNKMNIEQFEQRNEAMRIGMNLVMITLVFAVTACGGESQTLPVGNKTLITPIEIGSQNTAPLQYAAEFPTSLPQDAVQPWEELGSDGKIISTTSASSEFYEGPQTHTVSGDTSAFNGALRMASGDVGAGNLSYAMYRIPLGGDEPGVISVDASLRPMSDTSIGCYWVGLADYGNENWQWFGPVTDAHWRISAVQSARESANLTSSIGSVFVCVVAHDGAAVDVVGVGVDPINADDTTAPDAPSGLVLTPVASGVEANWIPVGGSDVAGYKLYYKDKAFGEHTAQFANSIDSLLGRSFILNATAQTFVAVSAVDKSGNESAISAVESATQLAGDAPEITLDVTGYSAMRGELVSLTASGATVYDWDTDGDGTYDILDDVNGTANVDTSQTGLIRPLVRGIGSDSTSVAMSAVSVIVSSNSRPVAFANAAPAFGDAPLLVVLTGSESTDFDGSIVGGGWDFDGDGTFNVWDDTDIVHLTSANYTYTTPGIYNAKLKVVDNEGAWDVDNVTVVVYAVDPTNSPPTASLTVDPASSNESLTVTLDASGSGDTDGSIVNYEWDFDGNGLYDGYGSANTTTHVYNYSGTFIAKVRVTDDSGAQATATAEVEVLHGPWTMRGHDNFHTGRSLFVGAQTDNLLWSYDTGSIIRSSPAVGRDGTVYIGSRNNKLTALNADGTLKWAFNAGNWIDSTPAIATDGTVYVGCRNDKLYAINSNGTEKWSFTTGDTVESSPSIGADGTVYVGSADHKLYAINPDGTEKWAYTTGGAVLSSPAIGLDGTIYVGSSDRKLYAINPDGTEQWSYTTGFMVYSSPAIGTDGTVYVGSDDRKLYAINPDGTEKWSFTSGFMVYSSPAIGLDGTIYVGSSDDKLYAINPDGTEQWSYATGDFVPSSPAIGADGTVYVGSNDFKVYAIKPDGLLLWSFATGISVDSSPAIGADGTVYIGSDDNKLYAFGNDPGNSPPTAILQGSPLTGQDSIDVGFSAADSFDPDGEITDYLWDFDGDGTYNQAGAEAENRGEAAPALQTYTTGVPVVVSVRVTGDAGLTDTASVTVTVHGVITQIIDATDSAGWDTSQTIVNGRPAISYHESSNGDLKYVRATNTSGSSWGTPVAVDTGGIVGKYTSLAIVNGNPAISYYDGSNGDLKYVRATNADGTAWDTPVAIDTDDNVGYYTSLVVVDGNPAIGYLDFTNGDLNYVRATDVTGTAWGTPQPIDASGSVGDYLSMAIVDGNPAISYYDSDNADLKFVRAADVTGSTWSTPLTVDTAGSVGQFTCLAIVNGRPAISYYDVSNGDLKYVRATSVTGGTWGSPVSIDTADDVGWYTSLVVADRYPAISYYDLTNFDLKYVLATNPNGTAWGTPFAADTVGLAGACTSMLMLNGRPAISYLDVGNNDLMYARLY